MSLKKYFAATALLLITSLHATAGVPGNDCLAEGRELYRELNYHDALTSFCDAAKDGNLEAMYLIGTMYREGKGVKAS